MHGGLIFLVTSFAASVVAAPVPVSPESPIQSPEPLMVREASGEAISPILDTMKREILERLDTIMDRTVPSMSPSDPKDKRDTVWKDPTITTGLNDKRDDFRIEGVASSVADKRDDLRSEGAASSINDKRDDLRIEGVASSVADKRDDLRSEGAPSSINDKRERVGSTSA